MEHGWFAFVGAFCFTDACFCYWYDFSFCNCVSFIFLELATARQYDSNEIGGKIPSFKKNKKQITGQKLLKILRNKNDCKRTRELYRCTPVPQSHRLPLGFFPVLHRVLCMFSLNWCCLPTKIMFI